MLESLGLLVFSSKWLRDLHVHGGFQAHGCDRRNEVPSLDDLGGAQNQMVAQNKELRTD